MKFLILIIAVLLLVGMIGASIRRLTGGKKGKPTPSSPTSDAKSAAKSGTKAIKQMRACAHCGVHAPEQEMVIDGAHAYCSAAHRNAGPSAGAS